MKEAYGSYRRSRGNLSLFVGVAMRERGSLQKMIHCQDGFLNARKRDVAREQDEKTVF